MGWGELPPTSELGRSLLLASASWRGSERSKEDAARLLEPAGIWWGLFFLSTVCRCGGMNKRVRKIYCSHSLAVALYLYSGSGGGERREQVGMLLRLGESQTLVSLFAKSVGCK